MNKLFLILLLAGCNEPKPTTPQYQVADWLRINKLVTEIEKREIERCIKDRSTCQPASIDAQDMVRSLEK